MAKILGMGNALVDLLVKVENDHLINEFSLAKGGMRLVNFNSLENIIKRLDGIAFEVSPGGSAANTIYGLARLGLDTGFIGKVGNDQYGRIIREAFNTLGIRLHILESNSPTGIALTLVTPDFERTFAVHLGAALELIPEDIQPIFFKGYDFFHVEGFLVQNRDLLIKSLQLARDEGLQVSFDLASFDVVGENLTFLQEVVKEFVDILFANSEEAKAFTGLEGLQALSELTRLVPIAILKLGHQGSIISDGNRTVNIAAVRANSIDTTGAGDLYAAGFLYGYSRKLPLEICGNIGSLLAGKVTEVIGSKMDDQQWQTILKTIQTLELPH